MSSFVSVWGLSIDSKRKRGVWARQENGVGEGGEVRVLLLIHHKLIKALKEYSTCEVLC